MWSRICDRCVAISCCEEHTPLLLAPDGRRLSKRDRDLDLGVLRENMSAGQLIGRLAVWLGLMDREYPVTPRELASDFDWSKVRREDIRLP